MADRSELQLTFQSDFDDPDVALLSRVHGHQRLSCPYEFELWLDLELD